MANELNNIPQKIPQGYYAIKNWRKFQHYKHRNPPWIKLHTNLLSSPDWIGLSDTSRLSMLCCMLVGAMHDGCVPNDSLFIKRVCHINWRVDFKPLLECGFLTETLADASDCKQMRTNADTETETETETEKKDISVDLEEKKKRTSDEEGEFERFWKSYPRRKGSNPKQLAKIRFISAIHKEVASASEIVAAAGRYADEQQSIGKVGTEFIAQASTWLNQERYLDYRILNGGEVNKSLIGLSPEQKKELVQEEMRKFREEERNTHVE